MEYSEKTTNDWFVIAENAMFYLVNVKEPFTADDFHKIVMSYLMPPNLMKKFAGSMFREFQAAGYIKKTQEYKLSTRNGSSPLPIWIAATQDAEGEEESR